MTFEFDVEAAVDAIAAREETIIDVQIPASISPDTPTLSISESFTYGQTPTQVDLSSGPVVTHIQIPSSPDTAPPDGQVAVGNFQAAMTIRSHFLIVLDKPDQDGQYNLAQGIGLAFWKPIIETFRSRDAQFELAEAAGAGVLAYELRSLIDPLFGPIPWAPVSITLAQNKFWAFVMDHYFLYEGG
jgi:hypothetical protein